MTKDQIQKIIENTHDDAMWLMQIQDWSVSYCIGTVEELGEEDFSGARGCVQMDHSYQNARITLVIDHLHNKEEVFSTLLHEFGHINQNSIIHMINTVMQATPEKSHALMIQQTDDTLERVNGKFLRTLTKGLGMKPSVVFRTARKARGEWKNWDAPVFIDP